MKAWVTLLVFTCSAFAAEVPFAPDARYKADILLIVAHPDDDVVIGGYLAKAVIDDHKRIAVIYCTSGDGGGNAVGNEAGAALGQMRVIEARRALAHFGIDNVWFLGAHDTPSQSPLRSLDNWNHGRMLDGVVRLMRLTRPDVVITWMPASVVGENHGDHQASGVLATEAFDISGDPTQFPEQVSAPRNRTGMSNLTEGLHPWQPQKLYFATDAYEDFGPYWHDAKSLSPYRRNFLDDQGPSYPNTAISPARHKSYARLTAEQQTYYLTQEGSLGTEALTKNSDSGFDYPTRLLFGKSVTGGSNAGDVFQGLTAQPAAFTRTPGYQASAPPAIELGAQWEFYRHFWRVHALDRLATFMPVPEIGASFHQTLQLPFNVTNTTALPAEVQLTSELPAGWIDGKRSSAILLQPGQTQTLQAIVTAPQTNGGWQELTWHAVVNGKVIGTAKVRAYVERSGGMPQ
jgi:LmbE family N-acetylglucosaminyl deacetylase